MHVASVHGEDHRQGQAEGEQRCPADELFYKGQLFPIHHPPPPLITMVCTLFLTSASSTDTDTIASRDSNGNSSSSAFSAAKLALSDCESSRPSSVTEERKPAECPTPPSAMLV
ncbi:putative membrane-associated kinase regulator 1 [Canna indica]|uniref:Membrane-associated kinase regulator 1 n=1 Tax=Canna indica TaxID=4628 RepID=A0AAQ3QG49_9LILI|nr:putative membrane-associated kinase regulator 1 [Canna indica]